MSIIPIQRISQCDYPTKWLLDTQNYEWLAYMPTSFAGISIYISINRKAAFGSFMNLICHDLILVLELLNKPGDRVGHTISIA